MGHGLIIDAQSVCGVRVDRKELARIRKCEREEARRKGEEEQRQRRRRRADGADEGALLREMMANADAHDAFRKGKCDGLAKRSRREDEREAKESTERDGRYLKEMGTKLYMDHSDTLQSRLSKKRHTLLKRHQL